MQHLIAVMQDPAKAPEKSAPQQAPAPLGFDMLLMMLAIFGVGYFLLIRPMRRKEKMERENLLSSLKKNDEVLTGSGIFGTIASIKDDEVVLKLDDNSNAKMRVLKSAIARIINPKEPPKDAQTTDNAKAGNVPGK